MNIPNVSGETPLHAACWNGHVDIVDLLLKFGSDANLRNDRGATALHIACYKGRADIVSIFIKHGCDVRVVDNRGQTALHLACCSGDNTTDSGGQFVSMQLLNYSHPDIIPSLNECHNMSETFFTQEENSLYINIENDAFTDCLNGDYNSVASFVEAGWDINMTNADGETLLHVACWNGHVDIADLLAKHGCDLDLENDHGSTALHVACSKSNTDLVYVLIKHGCDVRVKDNQGRTPLQLASYWRDPKLSGMAGIKNVPPEISELLAAIKNNKKDDTPKVELLLESGLNSIYPVIIGANNWHRFWCHSDYDYSSRRWEDIPLILASFLGKLSFVEILLNFEDRRVNSTDDYGRTALFYACQRGHLDVVRHLVKSGADINHRDGDGNTPLHEAIHFRRVEIVRELVESGADYNLKNADRLSARQVVRRRMMTSDERKRRIHREMFEIIDRQRELLLGLA